jgi:hypothetical protein
MSSKKKQAQTNQDCWVEVIDVENIKVKDVCDALQRITANNNESIFFSNEPIDGFTVNDFFNLMKE